MLKYFIHNAVGPLCEYNENSAAETVRQTCGSYSDYFNSLNFTCQRGEPGKLIWRPDDNTPDLVYYQVITKASCTLEFIKDTC